VPERRGSGSGEREAREPRGTAAGAAPVAGPGDRGRHGGLELMVLGTGLVFTLTLMGRLESWSLGLGRFQALYAAAFACFALAMLRLRSASPARAAWLVFAVAAAARLALLPAPPSLSDDVYRYVWEGKVAAAGLDPYHLSPRDPALAALRDASLYPRINHPELATLYPPLALAGFALVARLSPTVTAIKLWVILHDLALVLLLLAWARSRGLSPLGVIAYAWNPLVLVEYAGSGHSDPTALVWLIAALMWAGRRPVAAALALTVGVLVKLAPLVALPALLRGWPWRARLVALAATGLGLGGFVALTRGADSGLTAYARTWANNELAFHYLSRLVPDPLAARGWALALLVLAVVAAAWGRPDAARATRVGMRLGFVLTPVAHPWYLGWAMALEPLAPSAPWLLLSFTAILSYGVLVPPAQGGAYHLSLAGRWCEYGAPLALALGLAWAARRRAAAVTRA